MRTVAKGSESGRELPGGPDVVLLDDGVFSLYHPVAELATPAGRTLTAIFPRSGKRATFTARRESGSAGGAGRVALSGDITGTLVTDAHGRLERLELPGQGHGRHPSRVGPLRQVVIRQCMHRASSQPETCGDEGSVLDPVTSTPQRAPS